MITLEILFITVPFFLILSLMVAFVIVSIRNFRAGKDLETVQRERKEGI